jgi:hypothetical protein
MKKVKLLMLLTCIGLSVNAQNKYFEIYTDSAALKKQNDSLITDMERMIKVVQPSFSFKDLTTEIPKTFMPGQYRQKTNKIYHLTWDIGGPPMIGFLTKAMGSEEAGKKMAGLFFYGFFLPHEVGHAFQFHANNVPDNNYDSEYKASELAVVYWRAKGKQKELEQCYQIAKNILQMLKNPVPENSDAKQYITDHYQELLRDPVKYAYIQFSQIVNVMENKSLPDFNTYVKSYFAK